MCKKIILLCLLTASTIPAFAMKKGKKASTKLEKESKKIFSTAKKLLECNKVPKAKQTLKKITEVEEYKNTNIYTQAKKLLHQLDSQTKKPQVYIHRVKPSKQPGKASVYLKKIMPPIEKARIKANTYLQAGALYIQKENNIQALTCLEKIIVLANRYKNDEYLRQMKMYASLDKAQIYFGGGAQVQKDYQKVSELCKLIIRESKDDEMLARAFSMSAGIAYLQIDPNTPMTETQKKEITYKLLFAKEKAERVTKTGNLDMCTLARMTKVLTNAEILLEKINPQTKKEEKEEIVKKIENISKNRIQAYECLEQIPLLVKKDQHIEALKQIETIQILASEKQGDTVLHKMAMEATFCASQIYNDGGPGVDRDLQKAAELCEIVIQKSEDDELLAKALLRSAKLLHAQLGKDIHTHIQAQVDNTQEQENNSDLVIQRLSQAIEKAKKVLSLLDDDNCSHSTKIINARRKKMNIVQEEAELMLADITTPKAIVLINNAILEASSKKDNKRYTYLMEFLQLHKAHLYCYGACGVEINLNKAFSLYDKLANSSNYDTIKVSAFFDSAKVLYEIKDTLDEPTVQEIQTRCSQAKAIAQDVLKQAKNKKNDTSIKTRMHNVINQADMLMAAAHKALDEQIKVNLFDRQITKKIIEGCELWKDKQHCWQ